VSTVDETVEAVRSGLPVIIPTDTVYGLCGNPYSYDAALRVYMVKQRPGTEPMALLASDVDLLLDSVPELRGPTAELVRALLPGPFTLVLPNPARRYRWLAGSNPDAIGVRVPELTGDAKAVLERLGALVATSANFPGLPDPRRLEDVDGELRWACGAEIDGGELPGVPSTVLDLTGPEPRVLREGAVPAAEALKRVEQAATVRPRQ
jgi:L-threonylcarbamoyladenylate synthase